MKDHPWAKVMLEGIAIWREDQNIKHGLRTVASQESARAEDQAIEIRRLNARIKELEAEIARIASGSNPTQCPPTA